MYIAIKNYVFLFYFFPLLSFSTLSPNLKSVFWSLLVFELKSFKVRLGNISTLRPKKKRISDLDSAQK